MRLLTKTNLNYIWLNISVLSLSGFLLYGFLYTEISAEIKEQLQLQENLVVSELAKGNAIQFPLVEVIEMKNLPWVNTSVFKDTLLYDPIQQENEGYYLLRETRKINNKVYSIQVMTTHIGWSRYSQVIFYNFICIAVMLIVVGFGMNYLLNRQIWKPIKINLRRLKSYSVSSTERLKMEGSNINEFRELNNVVLELAHRAKSEYNALKEFTENASHEIQTPLTIIQSRLERISQLEHSPEMSLYIVDAKQAIKRLSRVNKGLLLLAKLDNGVFPDEVVLDLSSLLLSQIDQVEDLIQHNEIKLKTKIQAKMVSVSKSLMEILLSNLLSNMVNHSPIGANAAIELSQNQLIFKNTGSKMPFEESMLFERFVKSKAQKTGNGLGLPIVKQICMLYGWKISHNFSEEVHTFAINF